MDKIIKFKHWLNKKRTAVKLSASAVSFPENPKISPRIMLQVWQGREEFGKTALLEIGEALLLADWLRESALELLREQAELVVEP